MNDQQAFIGANRNKTPSWQELSFLIDFAQQNVAVADSSKMENRAWDPQKVTESVTSGDQFTNFEKGAD